MTIGRTYHQLRSALADEGWAAGVFRWMLVGDVMDDVEQATRRPCTFCGSRRLVPRCFHKSPNLLKTYVLCAKCGGTEER